VVPATDASSSADACCRHMMGDTLSPDMPVAVDATQSLAKTMQRSAFLFIPRVAFTAGQPVHACIAVWPSPSHPALRMRHQEINTASDAPIGHTSTAQ